MSINSETKESKPDWYSAISKYSRSNPKKAIWQLVNTFIPYIGLWILMVYFIKQGYPYWLTLALAVLAALFLIRIFIFFHDCCHSSFFHSPRANTILGYITGVMTFTPYQKWRSSHARHHLTVGDLDRRGTGDVTTLTVDEYIKFSRLKRLGYRFYRNPLVLLGLGPIYTFLIENRVWQKGAKKKERASVIITNLMILAIIIALGFTIGFREYVMIQLPIIFIAGVFGIWLFYVQHQFQGVYWARHDKWNRLKAALQGSSYYKLPKVLQWFSGNIGLHHIHHVRPNIPNYNLQQCYDDIPALQQVKPLTIRESLKSLGMKLWDEKNQELVGFRAVKKVSH